MRRFQMDMRVSRGLQISLVLLGILITTGLAVAQGTQTVSGLIELIQAISTGNNLLSSIYMLVGSGGATGAGLGIILGSGTLYIWKKNQIENKLG